MCSQCFSERQDAVAGGYSLEVGRDWVAHTAGTTRFDVGDTFRVAVIGDETRTTGGDLEVRAGDKASHVFAADFKTVVGHPDRDADRTTFIYGSEY